MNCLFSTWTNTRPAQHAHHLTLLANNYVIVFGKLPRTHGLGALGLLEPQCEVPCKGLDQFGMPANTPTSLPHTPLNHI